MSLEPSISSLAYDKDCYQVKFVQYKNLMTALTKIIRTIVITQGETNCEDSFVKPNMLSRISTGTCKVVLHVRTACNY